MKIWQRSLAKSPKIIVGANFLIQASQFAIVMLGKIVCGDLVDPFGSVIILPLGSVNYTEYRNTEALKIANIVQLQEWRNSQKPL